MKSLSYALYLKLLRACLDARRDGLDEAEIFGAVDTLYMNVHSRRSEQEAARDLHLMALGIASMQRAQSVQAQECRCLRCIMERLDAQCAYEERHQKEQAGRVQ
jgi:hypothetical protein